MNRGIARRTLFERRCDFRYFTAQLARAVRRGELEIHAYCLMGTHYHLLVRSPRGELARAMFRIQTAYSRWFNRSRRRDGSLVRARYTSKPIESLAYRRAVVRYIDANPCKARIVPHASDYPYGSAFLYARTKGPPWLERSWVERTVREWCGGDAFLPEHYARVFSEPSRSLVEVVEARMRAVVGVDSLDNLVTASSKQVQAWMVRKARLADGTQPNLPIISVSLLKQELLLGRPEAWTIVTGQVERDGWQMAFAGLGRELCGMSIQGISEGLNVSHSTASRLCRFHQHEVQRGGEYSLRVAHLVRTVLRLGWDGV